MSEPPRLTDRPALARNRARAARVGPVLFLQEEVADELQERLTEVNRTFTAPAIVTAWPGLWRARLPAARIVADTPVLDLDPGAHDLVLHVMCLHWADDPVGQLIQCRRALQPDGLFLGATAGGRSLQELRAALAEAEVARTGGLSARVLPMADIRDLGGLLQRAGFALPVADAAPRTILYRGLSQLVADLRAAGEGNALAARSRTYPGRGFAARVEAIYRAHFGAEDGRIPATSETVFLTGWAPAETQPRPLRPGSAAARLADALRTEETRLPGPD
jgi:SAM-dependent methyltransferase